MHYSIQHQTNYQYNQSVYLQPHLLRLRPISNSFQTVHSFQYFCSPFPVSCSEITDLDGNYLIKLQFNQATESLSLSVQMEVETLQTNPFNYLLESWAINLPYDYPTSLKIQLSPYLENSYQLHSDILEIIYLLLDQSNNNTSQFLFKLMGYIYENFTVIVRDIGDPFHPNVTWTKKQGSCRDLVVLCMAICRTIGLATRFVSGYQEGDPDQDHRHLHAWMDVYLPGGGWRGYDPTHGLAVVDRHIMLCASANPLYTTPIAGAVIPVKSFMETGLPLTSHLDFSIHLISRVSHC